MTRARPLVATLLALAALPVLAGCLSIYTETKLIRKNEKRAAVVFESVRAWETFHLRFSQAETPKCNEHTFLIPLINLHTAEYKLSRNAFYNDEVVKADLDADGTITEAEAEAYNRGVLPPPDKSMPGMPD